MYHFELRQFPHNACRFNLSEGELRAIVEPWVRERVVEVAERRWSPPEAKLMILEGPELGVAELGMGRGWSNAQRKSEDVTARVLAALEQAIDAAAQTAAAQASAAHEAAASTTQGLDPLAFGVQIASLLGADPAGLLEAWRAAAMNSPGLAPSETLALAEQALGSSDANQP